MKKKSNTLLLLILLVLLSAFVLTKVFRSPSLESNLDADIFRIDTSDIAAIKITPAGKNDMELLLKENDTSWTIHQDERKARVDKHSLETLLSEINSLQPERIVSRKKEKWDDYHVGDTSAIQLVLYNAEMNDLAEWRIGSEKQGNTYVRPENEDEVYIVRGHLGNLLLKDFSAWRDKSFLKIAKAAVTKITFRYPADSGYVLEKKDQHWMVANDKADSLKVENYLSKLQLANIDTFADDFSPATPADITLLIEQGTSQCKVTAWKAVDGKWILNSSVQPDVYFSDTSFPEEYFVAKEFFLKEGQEKERS